MLMTTKKHKKIVEELNRTITKRNELIQTISDYNNEIADKLESMFKAYPFNIGDKVFDIQLRSSKGRFTKTKPSREHSIINEVIVDKKNYFNLVDRYNSNDVFKTLAEATDHLDSVCVE